MEDFDEETSPVPSSSAESESAGTGATESLGIDEKARKLQWIKGKTYEHVDKLEEWGLYGSVTSILQMPSEAFSVRTRIKDRTCRLSWRKDWNSPEDPDPEPSGSYKTIPLTLDDDEPSWFESFWNDTMSRIFPLGYVFLLLIVLLIVVLPVGYATFSVMGSNAARDWIKGIVCEKDMTELDSDLRDETAFTRDEMWHTCDGPTSPASQPRDPTVSLFWIVTEGGVQKIRAQFDAENMKPENIQVKTLGSTLKIRSRQEEEGTYHSMYKEYCRRLTLPKGANLKELSCYLENGLVTLEAPYSLPVAPAGHVSGQRPRMIPIDHEPDPEQTSPSEGPEQKGLQKLRT